MGMLNGERWDGESVLVVVVVVVFTRPRRGQCSPGSRRRNRTSRPSSPETERASSSPETEASPPRERGRASPTRETFRHRTNNIAPSP